MAKHAGGRPSKFKPEYCEAIIDFMSNGRSAVAFAHSIGVCRDTITEWVKVHPEFSLSFKRASQAAQSYYEDVLTRGMNGEIKNFNVVACIFAMKNRFGADWREKQEVAHSGSISLESLVVGSIDSKKIDASSTQN